MCYHNNQQANRQTEQENPMLCCPESNNVITISCSVEKDANIETDTEMEQTDRDGQTDKAKRVLLPNAKSEAHSLTTILLMCVV